MWLVLQSYTVWRNDTFQSSSITVLFFPSMTVIQAEEVLICLSTWVLQQSFLLPNTLLGAVLLVVVFIIIFFFHDIVGYASEVWHLQSGIYTVFLSKKLLTKRKANTGSQTYYLSLVFTICFTRRWLWNLEDLQVACCEFHAYILQHTGLVVFPFFFLSHEQITFQNVILWIQNRSEMWQVAQLGRVMAPFR